jgi:hypothetical protein
MFNTDPGPADDHTTDPTKAAHCLSILGDFQPGITDGTVQPSGLTDLNPGGPGGELPPYAGGVCPDASTWESICRNTNTRAGFTGTAPTTTTVPTAPAQQPTPDEITKALEDLKEKLKKPIEDLDKLREKLGLPPTAPLPPEVTQGVGLGGSSSSGSSSPPSSTGLLDFLLGP